MFYLLKHLIIQYVSIIGWSHVRFIHITSSMFGIFNWHKNFLEGEVNSITELVTPLLLQLMGIYADSQWLLHEKKMVWSNRMSLH